MNGAVTAPRVTVVTCACTGAAALSGRVGLPVVLADATLDVPALLGDLNRSRHGGLVRGRSVFSGPTLEPGWDDWDVVPMRPPRCDEVAAAPGVSFSDGRIVVSLPPATTVSDFRTEMHGALRHLAVRRVMDRPAYRWSGRGTVVDRARYARGVASDRAASRFRLVDDLVVLDPTIDGDAWRLFWLCVSARLAIAVGGRSTWA